MAMLETLQKDLEKELKKRRIFFTRLRTPRYGYRGVRYPGDFVLWLKSGAWLIECKQRASLPLRPSDIRQLPFMKQWYEDSAARGYIPKAGYGILVSSENSYYFFNSLQAVQASYTHKGLTKEQAVFSGSLSEIIDRLELGF